VKVTKETVAENRTHLVQAAARLIREKGVDGVGVAEICQAAGLTHGALYAQFPSKEALAAAAFDEAFEHSFSKLTASAQKNGASLKSYLDFLISARQRDNIIGCPLTASASDIARRDEALSSSFAEGFERMVDAIEAVLGRNNGELGSRDRALTIVAAEIGAIAVARAIAKSKPALSNRVLTAAHRVLGSLEGEQAPSRSAKRRKT